MEISDPSMLNGFGGDGGGIGSAPGAGDREQPGDQGSNEGASGSSGAGASGFFAWSDAVWYGRSGSPRQDPFAIYPGGVDSTGRFHGTYSYSLPTFLEQALPAFFGRPSPAGPSKPYSGSALMLAFGIEGEGVSDTNPSKLINHPNEAAARSDAGYDFGQPGSMPLRSEAPTGGQPQVGFGEIFIDTNSDGLAGYWAQKFGLTADDLRRAKELGLTADDLRLSEEVVVVGPKNGVRLPVEGPSATMSPTLPSPVSRSEVPAPPSPPPLSAAAVDAISRDLVSLDRFDFYWKYKDRLDPKILDQLLPVTRKPEFKPPTEDKTLYIDASGRQGTAESLARNELLDRASDVAPSSVLGGIYSLAATALGGDAREAVRLGKIGDAVSSVATIAAFGAASLPPPGSLGPATQASLPAATPASLPRRLPIVNPHFAPTLTPGDAFQGATLRVADKLKANRAIIPNYLNPGELRLSTYGVWAERIVFGNAVERALARGSEPTGFLTHTGDIRPAPLGGPDFVGAIGTPYEGLLFQVTSERGFVSHVEKSPAETIFGIYGSY